MSLVDMKAVAEIARSDPEFSRETRYLNGAVKIGVADEQNVLTFKDGKLLSIDTKEIPDAECKIFVKGTREHWLAMMEKYPRPFYQCLQSSAVRHQLQLSDTNETFAYLPALNRLMQLIRNHHNKG